ncbi:hypothetical protein QE152_g30084 [Popillia japonica]|uniref:Uncharacterized protein n=1 Tax=Popillia japonica TaxID=7064 RepID=A0AAW1JGP7_POPJA
MATVQRKEMFIQDAETNTIFSIMVTPEEGERIENDIVFATEKLNELKEKSNENHSAVDINESDESEDSISNPSEEIGDQMLSDIVKFANVKGRERLQKYNRPDTRHLVKDTLEEIQAFIALLYATGIQKSGRTEGTGMICGVPTTSALIFLEQ